MKTNCSVNTICAIQKRVYLTQNLSFYVTFWYLCYRIFSFLFLQFVILTYQFFCIFIRLLHANCPFSICLFVDFIRFETCLYYIHIFETIFDSEKSLIFDYWVHKKLVSRSIDPRILQALSVDSRRLLSATHRGSFWLINFSLEQVNNLLQMTKIILSRLLKSWNVDEMLKKSCSWNVDDWALNFLAQIICFQKFYVFKQSCC